MITVCNPSRMRLLLVAGVVSLFCSSGSNGRGLKLVKNGYEGIVVAISPSVDQDFGASVISSIKRLMTEASEVLFAATRNRTYFGKINILLPVTWTNTHFDSHAIRESFEKSDIQVEIKGIYGDQPYTVRAGGCGHPGKHVVLTQNYLTDDQVSTWWGPRAKMMVHEWAKLRWGVFEEFGYPNDTLFPLLYWANSEEGKPVLRPNFCSDEEPKGSFRDRESGDACSYLSGFPDDTCRFIPEGQQTASSSLMALYYLSSTKSFCDSVKGMSRHDQLPPTRHNLLCNGLSVWDIIRLHRDFSNDTSPSTEPWSPPSFAVLRQEDATFILLLDRSEDAAKSDRLRKVDHSIQSWILHQLDSASSLAIVTLGAKSRIERNLTRLTDLNVRKSLVNPLPSITSGKINMSEGLSLALTQLNRNKSNYVVVMVVTVDVESAITNRQLANSGARLVLLLLGSSPSDVVERVAVETGGAAYEVPDGETGLQVLEDALMASLAYQPRRLHFNAVVKLYEKVYRGNDAVRGGSFLVDPLVGRNLVLRVFTDRNDLLQSRPILISPNSSVYNSSDQEDSLHVAVAERGVWRWKAVLSGRTKHYFRVSVTVQQRELGQGAIHVLVWVGPGSSQLDASRTPVTVYAEVKQGSNPVVGGMVRAFISHPNSKLKAQVLQLSDEGRFSDIQQGDGIYSRHLVNYSTAGRYAVTVEVSGDENTFIYTHCDSCYDLPQGRRRYYCCGSKVHLDCMKTYPTGTFRRFSTRVVFQVTGLPPASDPYPPGRVGDLQVACSLSQANLTWTAPGDDYDSGIVKGYEIRLSENRDDLLEWSVGRASCGGGKVSVLLSLGESRARPELFLRAGRPVSLRLSLLQPLRPDKLYFVALQATDDVDKKSLVSNVATLIVQTVPEGQKPLRPWQVALLVLGCIIVIADVVGGFFYLVEKYYFQEMD